MPAGRPPKWTDPVSFEKAIEDYFETAEVITWTGLALHMGFSDRNSLHDYGKKPEFSTPIKKALTRVEQAYEERLHGNSPTGAIFALKNFSWKDKQEVDQNVSGGLDITVKWDDSILPTP